MTIKSFSVKAPLWLFLYFIIWAFAPFILTSSYPLDVPEGIYWGREWQWGYYKHPPLSSWILYSFYHLFGHIGPYILSQSVIALSIWLAYLFGRQLMSRERAFIGAMFLLAIFYYTWPSLEFNHNIAQMPVWLGLVYVFYLAIKNNRWCEWLLFGMLAGAGLLIKYTVAVLLISMLFYSLLSTHRRLWLTPKPWIALIIAFAVFSPNLYWLIQHNWISLTYASARSAEDAHRNGHFAALGYLATQIINHLPIFIILLCTRTRLKPKPTNQTILHNDWLYLLWMGFFPTFMLVMVGLLFSVGLRDMWGMPMWGLSGLIIVAMIPDQLWNQSKCRSLLKGIAIWAAIVTILMIVYISFGARIRHKPSRMDWPQAALSKQADEQWQQLSNCRMDSITGSDWPILLVASYSKYAPSVMVSGKAEYSPWMNPRRLQHFGTMAVWLEHEQPTIPWVKLLQDDKNLTLKQGIWTIPWDKMPNHKPLKLVWQAYIPNNCLIK